MPIRGGRPPLEEILKRLPSLRPSLCKANLAGLYLGKANVNGTRLAGADLGGTNFAGAYLGSAELRNISLTSVKVLTCDQTRAAKTDRPMKLPGVMKCN